MHVPPQQRHHRVTAERRLAGQALEEDTPQGIDIRAAIDGPSGDQFRGRIVGSAGEGTSVAEIGGERRQAEVGEVDVLRRIRSRL